MRTPFSYDRKAGDYMAIIGVFPTRSVSYSAGRGVAIKDKEIGLETPVAELTQAEFNALTEEQKNSGLYFISDGQSSTGSVPGSTGGSSGVTPEQLEEALSQKLDAGERIVIPSKTNSDLDTTYTANGMIVRNGVKRVSIGSDLSGGAGVFSLSENEDISGLAKISVADGTGEDHAVTKRQLDAAVSSISSGGGSTGSSGGEIYSTEETRIGTWIDGKPLYRRCFLEHNVSFEEKSYNGSSSTIYLSMFLYDFDIIVKKYGVIRHDGLLNEEGIQIPVNNFTYDPEKQGAVPFIMCDIRVEALYANQVLVDIECFPESFLGSLFLVFEYTKTTDEPSV